MRSFPLARTKTIVISRPAPMRGGDLCGFGNDSGASYSDPNDDNYWAGFDTPEAPAEKEKPFDWKALNEGLNVLPGVLNAAGGLYATQQGAKTAAGAQAVQEAQLKLAAARMQSASSPSAGMPAWVLPVAIGAGVLLLLGGFFVMKGSRRAPAPAPAPATNPRRR